MPFTGEVRFGAIAAAFWGRIETGESAGRLVSLPKVMIWQQTIMLACLE
jgi:hypothetical protein